MKRPLALLLACILLLTTFAGCGKKKPGAKADDTAEYEALYAPVLKKYKQAFEEEWPREKFLETGLAPNLAGLEKTAEPSFAFLDLNNDKTPELFIGRADEAATVYDLYTADGENIKHLIDAAGETTLTLTDDARLAEKSDAYESLEVTTFYALKDDALTPTDSYIHDPDKIIDGMDEWYHRTGELPDSELDFFANEMESITKDDYDRETTDYAEAKLPMKSFDELVLEPVDGTEADTNAPSEDKEDDTQSEESELSALGESLYASILAEYRALALNTEGWFGGYSALSSGTPGYVLIDLDHDGTPELAVCGQGTLNEPTPVVELYAINGGSPKSLVSAYEISSMYICTDERIAYDSGSGIFAYLTINNGRLQCNDLYDAEYEVSSTTYYHSSADAGLLNTDGAVNWDWSIDTDLMQRITESEYQRGTNDYDAMVLDITPFAVTDAGMSQQEAYQSVMQKTKEARTDKGTQLEYAMHDINEDGLEELLILDKYHGFNATGNYRLFMYLDGVVIYLGYIDWDEGSLLDGSKKMYLMSGYADNYGTAVSIVNNELSTSEYNEFSSSDMASFGPPISFTAF